MIKLMATSLFLIANVLVSVQAAAVDKAPTSEIICQSSDHYCERIIGHSKGNHELDCTIIRPWAKTDFATRSDYPVIAWANGWGQGNVNGQCVSEGYRPGLIEWATDGNYIVVAANQWSARDVDVLACLAYVLEHEKAIVDPMKTGLAGHSQGGGAVIKSGSALKKSVNITATIAMNPFGPDWVGAGIQDGPVLILGGDLDTTTPPASFVNVWEEVQYNASGGVWAIRDGGTHNNDAWSSSGSSCADASMDNFGQFQSVSGLWWDWHLNGNGDAGTLQSEFDSGLSGNWSTEFILH
ncbi:MAG: putative esterase [Gammaproteobacteria bacterium]|jgi:predicted esterase